MVYKVTGFIGNKKYISKGFRTQKAALKHGYSKVYRTDGNTKRKSPLADWEVVRTVRRVR